VAQGRGKNIKVTLTPSTGTPILVWRNRDTYCARRADAASEPEVCLAVDLFEVIADLAGLDLERDRDADEAIRLAAEAQQLLAHADLEDSPAGSRRRSS